MKKLLSFFFVLTIIISALVMSASATTESAEGYYTYTIENGVATITDVDTSISGNITIPATLGGCTVTSIGGYAFENCSMLSGVNIPSSVTEIGWFAFIDCTGIINVNISDGLIDVKNNAFQGCTNLTNITIPDSVQVMGAGVFTGCTNIVYNEYQGAYYLGNKNNPYFVLVKAVSDDITNCVINNDAHFIQSAAFKNCGNLSTVDIPDNIKSIEAQLFYNCTALTEISIADSVTVIGNYAFYNCSNLSKVVISNSATTVGAGAFYGCSSLENIYIPESVRVIGASAFYGCKNLVSAVIPEGVEKIYDCTFQGCIKLENVEIPNSVKYIGKNVFSECDNLKGKQSGNAIYIGNENNPHIVLLKAAFTDITSCEINEKTKFILPNAFADCKDLRNVIIPNGIVSIDQYAFKNCSKLTSVSIPSSVSRIGHAIFSGCSSLNRITIPFVGGGEDLSNVFGSELFGFIFGNKAYEGGCETKQYSGSGIVLVGAGPYYIPMSLDTVIITGGSIEAGAFYGCNFIKEIILPKTLTNIPERSFAGCTSLEKITIFRNLKSVGENAFSNCTALQDVMYQGSSSNKSNIVFSSGNTALTTANWKYNYNLEHTYTDLCDRDCNICGLLRKAPHDYDNACDYKCNLCGIEREVTAHVYDNACDTNCNECEAAREVPDHVYDNVCDTTCNICNWVRSVPEHIYDNTCDSVCNNCDFTRTAPHSYEWIIEKDNNCGVDGIKYEECSVCYTKRNQNTIIPATDNHTFTDLNDTYCNVCEKEYFQIAFECNGGSSVENLVVLPNSSVKLPSTVPIRSGYNFVGWCSASKGDDIFKSGDTIDLSGNITLYAIWSKKCNSCNETGKTSSSCYLCGGKGSFAETETVDCTMCIGGKRRKCNSCGSTNVTYVVFGSGYYQCNSCKGLNVSLSVCNLCGGDGQYTSNISRDCSACSGGRVYYTCSSCAGEGHFMAITWIVDDKITTSQVKNGTIPSFSGSTDKFSNDKIYGYTFAGWNKSVYSARQHTIYIATYNYGYKDYNIVFKDWDGKVLYSQIYHYGDAVEPPIIPERETDGVYNYVFSGWDKEIVDCHGDATYTATYTSDLVEYTIKFVDDDNSVISEKTYYWGDQIIIPANPTKKGDNTYTYVFAGWDSQVTNCVGNAVYRATYDSIYIDYIVVFKNWDGSEISSQRYHYGDEVQPPDFTPTKEADNTYTYVFVGWDSKVTNCAGDRVYTAVYNKLTYINGDCNEDGLVNTTDLATLKLFLAGVGDLSNLGKLGADSNDDGVVNTADLAALKLMLAGINDYPNSDVEIQSCQYTIEKIDKSYRNKKGEVVLYHNYDLLQLKGDSKAVRNINDILKENKNEFLWADEEVKNMGEYAAQDTYSPYYNTMSITVAHNADGYISFYMDKVWYMGGISDDYTYGYTYNLATGEKATLDEITGRDRQSLENELKNIVSEEFYEFWGCDISDSGCDIENCDLEDFGFYLKDGEIVVVFASGFGRFTDIIANTGIYIK